MAILAGVLLALTAVFLVLQPLIQAASGMPMPVSEPLFSDSDDDEDDPALARRDRAMAALKEIDFDRATGKLSDEDYGKLKDEFTAEALDALRVTDRRLETSSILHPLDDKVEALIASARPQAAGSRRFCLECGAPMESEKKFCQECGTPVGASLP